jgi:hypothetical protein
MLLQSDLEDAVLLGFELEASILGLGELGLGTLSPAHDVQAVQALWVSGGMFVVTGSESSHPRTPSAALEIACELVVGPTDVVLPIVPTPLEILFLSV